MENHISREAALELLKRYNKVLSIADIILRK